MTIQNKRIIVIGAGAAGLMAAGRAAECGAQVLLMEKTLRPGNKLLISAQSRCNLSNTRELPDFIAMYGPDGAFLYRAFDLFFREDLLQLLQRFGVETVAEADGRIFPASNSSADVLKALESYIAEGRVQLETRKEVETITASNGQVTGVSIGKTEYPADAVILATGGASYPSTGSSGAGYRLAASLGHHLVKLRPALVPLVAFENESAQKMQGVSLSGVRLTSYSCKAEDIPMPASPIKDAGRGISGKSPRPPVIESRTGDVMLTHQGLSGPVTLLMSLAIVDALERGPVSVAIDLRPGLTWEEMRRELQKCFDRFSKRTYRNILVELLPPRLVEAFLEMSAIPREKCGCQIDADERGKTAQAHEGTPVQHTGPAVDGGRHGDRRRHTPQRNRSAQHGLTAGKRAVFLWRGDGHRRRHGRIQFTGSLLDRASGRRKRRRFHQRCNTLNAY